ncbi:MAG: prepilin-type N-terminal cleavage/methylation domain-containing protein [Planctomycetota bacterium]|jgi:prepilin-type N-terminal cleavage/methylation domain-containing protein
MKHKAIKSCCGFTLLEVLVVVTLSAMLLTVVLTIYGRVRTSAAVIMDRLQSNRLEDEVLQKIAEDIDRMAAPGFDATINFTSKATTDNHRSAELILTNGYYDKKNRKETYEQVVWRTWFDPGSGSMTLYRMHDGINVEDRMLQGTAEQIRDAGDEKLYVPVTTGVTFFELRVQKGESILSKWTMEALPSAVQIGISFTPKQQLLDGSVAVPPEDITYRTVAIDRTRMIPYQFIKKDLDLSSLDEDIDDPNDLSDSGSSGASQSDSDVELDEAGNPIPSDSDKQE